MKSYENILHLFETSEILGLVVLFFIINTSLVFIGLFIDLARQLFNKPLDKISRKARQWKDSAANVSIFAVSGFLENTAFSTIGIICLFPFYILTPFEIPTNTWTWLLSILVVDFSYYWMHRIEHEHRFFWAYHSTHHSSLDYNLTVSFRLSVIEGAIEWIFLIPMVLIGFDVFQTIISLVLVVQYQTWIHTESIGKLGWLDHVFNTPSNHRVHHGSNPQYIDKNYGSVLIIWDKLFGTYQKEEGKVIYGLTKNINTNNPISINFREYNNIYRDLKQCRNFKDGLRTVFGDLVWRPDYFQVDYSQADSKN